MRVHVRPDQCWAGALPLSEHQRRDRFGPVISDAEQPGSDARIWCVRTSGQQPMSDGGAERDARGGSVVAAGAEVASVGQ
jgi:hypothetical protein